MCVLHAMFSIFYVDNLSSQRRFDSCLGKHQFREISIWFSASFRMDREIQETSEQLVPGGTHKICWFGLVNRAPPPPLPPWGLMLAFL
jgi:hypothetical protein